MKARVFVQSKPPNGTLYVDGEEMGDTGQFYELEAGKTVTLEVRKKGYKTYKQDVEIAEGDQRYYFSLKRAPVRARRPKRRVARAPQPAPAAPVSPEAGPSSPEPRPEPAPEPAKEEALPAHGLLSVNARPWGEVYVDGSKVSDQTPLLGFKLRPGVHRVRVYFVSLRRYSAERTVRIAAGQNQTVFFRE